MFVLFVFWFRVLRCILGFRGGFIVYGVQEIATPSLEGTPRTSDEKKAFWRCLHVRGAVKAIFEKRAAKVEKDTFTRVHA